MSVTITRSPWVDDDGTGTTGTVINNAVKTDLYNQIDAALAKVAQLAGGNAFTGNQTIAGALNVTTVSGVNHFFTSTGAGGSTLLVNFTAPGAGNYAQLTAMNDTNQQLFLRIVSSTWVSGGYHYTNGGILACTGAGGLSIVADHASGMVHLWAGQAERLRINATGEVLINSTVAATAMLQIAHNPVAGRYGIAIQNTDPANSTWFMVFYNSANVLAGGITQATATTVSYNTSSDARLKDDAGRATDVGALRAVVVHDFTWKADGRKARGVFAQEAAPVFPHAITEGTDDTTEGGDLARPWMTDYSKFVPDLIVGWQQHDAAIAELRAALAAAKG